MYGELYEAWRREIENPEVQPLPADFYVRVSEYMQKIKDSLKPLDPKSLRATLLLQEQRNVNRIVKEMLTVRYRKLLRAISKGKLSSELLTAEEAKICEGFFPFTEAYQGLIRDLIGGQVLEGKLQGIENSNVVVEKVELQPAHKRVAVRFLKPIPAIIGSDMQTYGPFAAEDVASVPIENANILVKQGLAQLIEVI
ncbi:MAG TPA: hypothetical protein VK209_00465 [Candidatus Sulfotelmatobacter sp.]|nr:hypothetical protein [Candidatus Sulfotelmatobacter sp.]